MKRKSRRGIVLLMRDLTEQWILRVKNANLNVLGLHPFYKNHDRQLDLAIKNLENHNIQNLLKKANKSDISIELECHALSWLLPRSLFKDHEEWFRMNKRGKRSKDYNMCVTNLDALSVISENSTKLTEILMNLLPDSTHKYYFWQDDARNAFCFCERCKSYSPSEQTLIMMNHILEGIKLADPQGKIAYLAYLNTITPPSKIKPNNDVFLEFAPISRNYHLSIDSKWSLRNRKYLNYLDKLLSFFGSDNAQVLEYWLDCSKFSFWNENLRLKLPFKRDRVVKDMHTYRSMGIQSITSFAAFLDKKYVKRHGEPPIKEYGDILKKS